MRLCLLVSHAWPNSAPRMSQFRCVLANEGVRRGTAENQAVYSVVISCNVVMTKAGSRLNCAGMKQSVHAHQVTVILSRTWAFSHSLIRRVLHGTWTYIVMQSLTATWKRLRCGRNRALQLWGPNHPTLMTRSAIDIPQNHPRLL